MLALCFEHEMLTRILHPADDEDSESDSGSSSAAAPAIRRKFDDEEDDDDVSDALWRLIRDLSR